jgi:hypothetical protein
LQGLADVFARLLPSGQCRTLYQSRNLGLASHRDGIGIADGIGHHAPPRQNLAENVPPIVVPVDPDGVNEIKSPSLTPTKSVPGVRVTLVPAAELEAVKTMGEPDSAVPAPGAVPPATAGMMATATEQSVTNAPWATPETWASLPVKGAAMTQASGVVAIEAVEVESVRSPKA